MIKLSFEAIARIEDDFAIGISDKFNALFKLDLKTGMADCIGTIPDERIYEERLYTKALYINNKVYFVPAAANNIAVYDVEKNKVSTIKIMEADLSLHVGYQRKNKFNGGVVYKEYIYFVPCTYPGVIRVDTQNDQVEYFDTWIKNEKYMFRKSVWIDGNRFYVPSVINNIVFRFNMDNCKGELLHIGKNNNGCWSMCKVGEDFWMAPKRQGPIIKWNVLNNTITEFNDYPEEFKGNGFLFTQIYCLNGQLSLIPACANMEIKVDLSTETIEKSNIIDKRENSVVSILFELDEYIYLKEVENKSTRYIKLCKDNNLVTTYSFEINSDSDEYSQIFQNILKNRKEIVREADYFGLPEYIRMMVRT